MQGMDVQLNVKIPMELHKKIKIAAINQNVSIAKFIVDLLIQRFEKEDSDFFCDKSKHVYRGE